MAFVLILASPGGTTPTHILNCTIHLIPHIKPKRAAHPHWVMVFCVRNIFECSCDWMEHHNPNRGQATIFAWPGNKFIFNNALYSERLGWIFIPGFLMQGLKSICRSNNSGENQRRSAEVRPGGEHHGILSANRKHEDYWHLIAASLPVTL